MDIVTLVVYLVTVWLSLFLILLFLVNLYKLFRLKKNKKARRINGFNDIRLIREALDRSHVSFWKLKDGKYICDGFGEKPDISLRRLGKRLDSFFRTPAKAFFSNRIAGVHHLQLHGMWNEEDTAAGWYELRMVSERHNKKEVKRGFTIQIDDAKTLEAEMLETHRRYQNAQNAEGFTGLMRHEMRTPLNVIVGFSQLLSDPNMPLDKNDVQEFGNAIHDNGMHLMKLVEELQVMSDLENGQMKLDLVKYGAKVNIDICARNLRDILHVGKNLLIVEEGPLDSCCKVDSRLFSLILEKLVVNAFKFSDYSKPVTLGWKESSEYVEFFVKDQGIGISKENLPLVFKRFFKVDPNQLGLGLGLSVVKELTEQMNGIIQVESNLGEGSEFTVKFKKVAL